LIRIFIIKFIVPRWQPWELVMCMLYKEDCTAIIHHKSFNKGKTQMLKYRK